jgi:uncharacterized protein (DUF2126 family)
MTDDDRVALATLRVEAEVHDAQLARRGLDIWIGAEPTFTRRESTDPPWLAAAEGGDKLARARDLVNALGQRLPGGAALSRVIGRHFPEEDAARFAWGVRWPRAGVARSRTEAAPCAPALDAPPVAAPPFDPEHAWLTVTPDPGVVEVNLAPSPSLVEFGDQAARVWAAAAEAGLAPFRFRFNGDVTDSGGGGQITFGGAIADASPFFRYPDLLPGVLRYLHNHPALSYWFTGECVGSASQGPRPDEGARERSDELGLALEWLEHRADRGTLDRHDLARALAPLLVDASGNSHRAEVNVEKLWNPGLGARGTLGVIEFRALRMPPTPGALVAAAALFRAVIARCALAGYRAPLVDWQADLHDRWALPHFLARDLRQVLGDLDDHGLGLLPEMRRLLQDDHRLVAVGQLPGASLSIARALEFWPLVGDTASQELRGARIVDASTERWQLAVTGGAQVDWLVVDGRRVDLPAADSWAGDDTRVIGVRRRAWVPEPGFHPGLPAQDPMVITWGAGDHHQQLTIHGWRPGGGPYTGLPVDAAEATARRVERIRVETRSGPLPRPHGAHARTGAYTIDLRRPRADDPVDAPVATPPSSSATQSQSQSSSPVESA